MILMKQLLLAALTIGAASVSFAQAPATSRFDVRVQDAPARSFFEGLVDGTPTNMLVHPDVKGTITLQLKQVTLGETLEAVRDLYGYDFRATTNGYMVLPASMQARAFQLNYLDLQRVGVSKTRVSSGQITQSSNDESGEGAGADPGGED